MESIKVGLADDHRLFRKLTVSFLSTVSRINPSVVEAENGRDLLRKLRSERVDVVLMDISMPGMGGDEAAAVILRRYPETKVVILSVNDSPSKVKEMMDLGVHGYLL
ncbi:MAG: response regulator transcription factor, partial [Cyclobacteriaceae bacterium]